MANPIPEGWYDGKLCQTHIKDDSGAVIDSLWWDILVIEKNGKEYIRAWFEILDPSHAGQKYKCDMFLSDAAFPYTIKKLRAVGLVGSELDPEAEAVRGQKLDGPVRVCVEHDVTDDGKVYPKIGFVSASGGGGGGKRLDPAQRSSFGARMKAQMKGLGEQPAPASKKLPDDVLDDLGF